MWGASKAGRPHTHPRTHANMHTHAYAHAHTHEHEHTLAHMHALAHAHALLLSGAACAASLCLWSLGLARCGPLRTTLLDYSELVVANVLAALSGRPVRQRGRRRGLLALLLAYAALLMAGLDGITNKIHPGEAMDKNLYDLPPAELADVPTVCGSLREALENLEADPRLRREARVGRLALV